MASNQPKLLNLTTPIVRNQRTLVWLQQQNKQVPWSKWDGIVTSLSAYETWSKRNASIVGMIVTECPPEEEERETFLARLYEIAKSLSLLLISQSVLSLKSEAYWSENFDNVLNLSTLHETYPFLELSWDNTTQDAIACFALLCRYNRLVDCKISKLRSKIANQLTIAHGIQPNKTWLFTQFFRHSNTKRFEEIKTCLRRNCASPWIDKIVLLNEKKYSQEWKSFPGAEKIEEVVMGERLSYAHFLQYVHDGVPDNVYCILANADIYIEDSIRELFKTDMTNKMLALLRWDVDSSGRNPQIFGPRSDSQDTWIVLSNSVKNKEWDYSKFHFHLGHPGCDNAFAGHMLRNRFVISNPALTFQTYHLHESNVRNYDQSNIIRSDIYVNIVPSNIIDTKQERDSGSILSSMSNELVPFDIKSSSMSNEITYCTMLEKEGRYQWEPSTQNYYFEANIPIYSWKKACVTPNGLVYDLYHIYKGNHCDNPLYNYWMSSSTDIFTPLESRKKMATIPFKDTSIFKHPDTYLLHYVSRLKRLLSHYSDLSFWLPKGFDVSLQGLDWNYTDSMPVEFNEYRGVWAEDVVGLLPGPESLELGKEHIETLRAMLPSWKAEPTPYVCAFITDNTITESFIKDHIIPILCEKHSNWVIRYVPELEIGSYEKLAGVSLCVFMGSQETAYRWSKLWALPKNCCVIEFQQELQVHGEFQHLAHISEFKSWVLLLSKGKVDDVQHQITTQFKKWIQKNEEELMQ